MLRRSVFVVITFTLLDSPGLQVQLLIVSTLVYIVFVTNLVEYADKTTKVFELANESLFLGVCYFFSLFGMGGTLEPEARSRLGLSFCGLVVFIFVFNLTVTLNANIRQVYHVACLSILKKRRAVVLTERNAAREAISVAMSLNKSVNFDKPAQERQIALLLVSEQTKVESATLNKLKGLIEKSPKNKHDKSPVSAATELVDQIALHDSQRALLMSKTPALTNHLEPQPGNRVSCQVERFAKGIEEDKETSASRLQARHVPSASPPSQFRGQRMESDE